MSWSIRTDAPTATVLMEAGMAAAGAVVTITKPRSVDLTSLMWSNEGGTGAGFGFANAGEVAASRAAKAVLTCGKF